MNAKDISDWLSGFEVTTDRLRWDDWVSLAQDILRRHAKRNAEYALQERRKAAGLKLLEYIEKICQDTSLLVGIDKGTDGIWYVGDNKNITAKSDDLLAAIEGLPQQDAQHEQPTSE